MNIAHTDRIVFVRNIIDVGTFRTVANCSEFTRGIGANAKDKGECPTTRKVPILVCLLLSEKLSECGRRKRRSPTMKKPRQHSMKMGSTFPKNAWFQGDRGSDALSHSRTAGRYADRTHFVSARIQNALGAADLRTVREVSEISDETRSAFRILEGARSLISARNWDCRRPTELAPWAISPPDLLI